MDPGYADHKQNIQLQVPHRMTNSWIQTTQPKDPWKRHKCLIKGDKTKGLILSEDSWASAMDLDGNLSLLANFQLWVITNNTPKKCSL